MTLSWAENGVAAIVDLPPLCVALCFAYVVAVKAVGMGTVVRLVGMLG